MPTYRCLIADEKGRTVTRDIAASDETELLRSFSGTGSMLLKTETLSEPKANARPGRKIQKAVLEFTEMMELLIDSGLSLKDALEIAGSIGQKSAAGALALRLLQSIRKGASFAQAVEAASDTFPIIYRGMVGVGDRIGSVERIFPRLASYLRDRKALQDKISGALAYPILVMGVTILGAIGLSVFVMPRLETIFTGFGGNAADTIRKNIQSMNLIFAVSAGMLLFLLAALIIMKILSKKEKTVASAIDRRLLLLPVIGRFIASWETLNFAFAMETLVAGGVSVELAIEEAASVVTNNAYKEALLQVKQTVLKGGSLSGAFSARREFPVYLSQWITVGERSGKTERVFSQIRTYFQAEIEQTSAKFMTLIEPTLIVMIGLLILALVMGVVVPLFSMYGSIL